MEEYDEQLAIEVAWDFLRRNSTSTIKFGENLQDVSYVITQEGLVIIPAMIAMLQPYDTVMYVPDFSEGCMEMHVSLEGFDETETNGQYADRWRVYHGEPPDVQWAIATIDAVRFHDMFMDGEELGQANPLASDEAAFCTLLNTNHKDNVKTVCAKTSNVEVHDPVVVGVDPKGIDVRATFGIVRIEFPEQIDSVAKATSFVLET